MAGGGGGAWKVAYADFVTAMMALFLVLWIINQDEEIKGDVSAHFKTRFKSITMQSVGIIPIENADLIEAKRAHFDNQSAIPLDHVRRFNQDLVKAFIQNANYIDMKTLRENTSTSNRGNITVNRVTSFPQKTFSMPSILHGPFKGIMIPLWKSPSRMHLETPLIMQTSL